MGATIQIQQSKYSTDTNHQRAAILAWLLNSPLTTLQARQELDVMHPAARILELREAGHNIVTHWTTDSTGKAKHRVACYALLSEV
ncbi:helix-turn-helix protein [Methylobacter tundripaludum]|uniref:Helix-turn-helix protein n=1 Tax=Methylobacter tundripaludum TaxID=173365 RepID=A0A2S6HIL5_9GAMM|nr:helix-turn-helix domain-containing protein [Methylobacter tundripaludum]PPK77297.1 helix-turn-helix protein [Methylobacter tundripaludum]